MSKLMVSVAGIRGVVGDSLTPDIVAKYAAAFGTWLAGGLVMLGTDSRPSRDMVKHAAIAGLTAVGCNVQDLGIAATPTIQLWTEKTPEAKGGMALTASHNPVEWNALKLFDGDGRFLDTNQGREIQEIFQRNNYSWATWQRLGSICSVNDPLKLHIDAVLGCSLIQPSNIHERQFKVAVDGVGGAGGPLMVCLLKTLGCQVFLIGCEPIGIFHRNPEPLPEALTDLCNLVKEKHADIGFALDPDGDRLAVVDNTGRAVGEENTVVAAMDFVLKKKLGPVVVNLSTTQAVDDIAKRYGVSVTRSLVGESHVAKEMKRVGAVIGGEGNGGVMLPEIHTSRDATVGITLILQSLLESGKTSFELFNELPQYVMLKEKMPLGSKNPENLLLELRKRWESPSLDTRDGVKRMFSNGWIQVRPSNTEPILRIFVEAKDQKQAHQYLQETKKLIESIL
jgi:phosphomannomutase